MLVHSVTHIVIVLCLAGTGPTFPSTRWQLHCSINSFIIVQSGEWYQISDHEDHICPFCQHRGIFSNLPFHRQHSIASWRVC